MIRLWRGHGYITIDPRLRGDDKPDVLRPYIISISTVLRKEGSLTFKTRSQVGHEVVP
jgi:hypothetical protein